MSNSSPSHTSTTTEPWSGASQFLTNTNSTYDPSTGQYSQKDNATDPMGLYQQVSNFANQYKNLNPTQQGYLNDYEKNLSQNRLGEIGNNFTQASNLGNKLVNGGYDYNGNSGATPTANLTSSNAYTGDMANGRAAQGVLDPTNALSSLLSGTPNNPYLSQMNQANIDQALRGYGDAMQKYTQEVIPSINNDAFAAGQYGGSRQGVAEGIANQQMLRNARDLGIAAMNSGNQLFGNAYENAQSRMSDAANNLNSQAYGMEQFNAGQLQNNSQFNANNANDLAKFNAGNQLQNNQFNANLGMQEAAQNAQNAQTGSNLINSASQNLWTNQDQLFNSAMQAQDMPMQRQQDMLNALAGVITPGASLGGTTTTPVYNNTFGNILGGAGGTLGLLSMLKGM